jgi:N-acetylglucosaminyldiphosphoundecaprenol N-acetyl-beta-D-mannosaminyltransferase
MYFRYGDLSWDSAEAPEAPAEHPQPADASPADQPPLSHAKPPFPGSVRTNGQEMASPSLPVVHLHGVSLHAITEAGCIQYILNRLDEGHGGFVVTPNLDHLRRSRKDIRFGALVAEADLVLADGMPLIWASRLQGTPLPERVAGSDLISSLSAAAAERGRSLFLLGGAPGTAEGAAKVLRERHPGIRIVGTHCPPMGFEKSDEAMATIIGELVHADPDIVYVALGSPKQEMLVERIRRTLPEAWWLGVGNSFSFLCGEVPRAPRWMQRCGLEWAHRLLQEPRRLFKRYLVVGLPFAVSLMGVAAGKGLARRLGRRPGHGSHLPAGHAQAQASSGVMEREVDASRQILGRNGTNGHSPASTHQGNGQSHAPPSGNGRLMSNEAEAAVRAARLTRRTARTPGGEEAGITSLSKLRGLILLGGSIRPTPLTMGIGRSLLDLPLDERGSILDYWMEHAAEVARLAGLAELPVRVLVDHVSPAPLSGTGRGTLSVEQDRSELRGTGGVLGDLCADYGDEDLILVANAAQILLQPLPAIATALEKTGGEVSVVAHEDGTASGLMLLSGAALRLIPQAGFVDMKEQALPMIASRLDVTVVNRRRPTGLPVRTLSDYIMALRHYHGRRSGQQRTNDPLAEGWRPVFSLVEAGATVDPQARVHDSVVLRGGRVEQGAVVVRSIVGPGGILRRERSVVDELVTSAAAGGRTWTKRSADRAKAEAGATHEGTLAASEAALGQAREARA